MQRMSSLLFVFADHPMILNFHTFRFYFTRFDSLIEENKIFRTQSQNGFNVISFEFRRISVEPKSKACFYSCYLSWLSTQL